MNEGNPPETDYNQLRKELKLAVRRVCPKELVDREDDLVQVGMIRVMDLRRKSKEDRKLNSAYYKRVAYTTVIDEIRRIRRKNEISFNGDAEDEIQLTASNPNPEKQMEATQIGHGIRECLLRMITPRRLAVTLHLQGHSVPGAARLLGWSLKKTENLVYRGIKDLRHCLESKGLRP